MKKRLDQLLVERKLTKSREFAKRLILAGEVEVSSKIIDKAGALIDEATEIKIIKPFRYVSRGALKLQAAYRQFKINFKDKVVCDVGASTGGFTDFALQNGAKKVYAVDTGYGQLDFKLRQDNRVVVMERTDIRNIKSFPEVIDIITCDVSFISLKKVLPAVKLITQSSKPKAGSQIIVLFKPQFEVGKKIADRYKGVIKDPKIHQEELSDFRNWCLGNNFEIIDEIESPILGEKGNKEFLFYLKIKND